jgi:hypothetical protein
MPVRIRLALIVAAAVALPLTACGSSPAGSSSAKAAPGGFYGIARGTTPLDAQDAQTMRRAGVRTIRFLLPWAAVQPAQGSFNWGAADRAVGQAAAKRIQPVPFVFGSPAWVASEPAHPPIDTASQIGAWRAFLGAAVRRYGPGGGYWKTTYRQQFPGASPLPIRAWQIWNEPNLAHYFAPKPSATKYAGLLRISHNAIRAEDSKAKIVLAGMPGYGKPDTAWKFLNKLYGRHGFKRDFDAVALHPYARNIDQLKLEINKVRRVMRKHGDGRGPLWLTELGWGSKPPDRFGLNKGLRGQKRMLSRSFGLIRHHRARWRVQRLFWFDWRDPPKGQPQPCSFCSSAGLLEHNRHPKPAWRAYRRFANG